jgi:dTDP-4-amino-4,6-dideoxygalactose transaminase
LAVIAAGVTDGDEVITTPFSFVASANVMLYERAKPVFVDIDPQSLNLDPARIEAAISPRTKAILPVHAFGQPADMDPILDIAQRHNLVVIEDACEAIGAEYKGRKVGNLGRAGVFAFYPNKQMTTGEGGILVTDDDEWNNLFRSLRNQGRDVFDAWLNHSRLGYNYRLDEMSAALGAAQMGRIEELLAKREQVAHWYADRLRDIEGVTAPSVAHTTTRSSWFVYVVRFDPTVDRSRVMSLLEAQGIPSRPYFTPIHLQPFYRQRFRYAPGDFPITERVAVSTLALPFFSNISEEQVLVVCDTLREVIVQART